MNNRLLNQLVNDFISDAKENHLNIVKWEPNKSAYPTYMLLGGDKGILAYLNFYIHDKQVVTYNMDDLLCGLRYAFSELDRPVFNVHFFPSYNNRVLFDTYEQLKDELFYFRRITKKEMPHIYEHSIEIMGDKKELFSIFMNLKKNNVTLY